MFRLWQRLFLAIALLSTLALAGFVVWQQQSFRRGFIGYLNEVALERLQPATLRLAAAHAENGGWDFLRGDPRRFADLIDPDGRRLRGSGPPPGFDPRLHGEAGPDERSRFERREPPPFHAGPPPGVPRFGPPGLAGRVQLLDASGAHVAGNAEVGAGAPSLPVITAGETIGTRSPSRRP